MKMAKEPKNDSKPVKTPRKTQGHNRWQTYYILHIRDNKPLKWTATIIISLFLIVSISIGWLFISTRSFHKNLEKEYKNIEFDFVNNQIPDERIINLLIKITSFNREYYKKYNINKFTKDNHGLFDGLYTIINNHYLAKSDKQQLWNQLKRDYPELKLGEYSDQAYYRFTKCDLLRLLAPYMIFVSSNTSIEKSLATSTLSILESIPCFCEVKEVKKSSFEMWNEKISVDVAYLTHDYIIDNKSVNIAPSDAAGMYIGHNIILMFIDEKRPTTPMVNFYGTAYEELKDLNMAKYTGELIRQNDKKQLLKMTYLYLSTKTNNYFAENYYETVLSHEGMHAITDDPNSFFYQQRQSQSWYWNWVNEGIDNEINSFLAEVVYGKGTNTFIQEMIMYNMMAILENPTDEEVNFINIHREHYLAHHWLLIKVVDQIMTNPEDYRHIIYIDKKMSVNHQRLSIIYQLPNFTDHPEKFEKLCNQIMLDKMAQTKLDDYMAAELSVIFSKFCAFPLFMITILAAIFLIGWLSRKKKKR